jgi:nucleotide-binding universal stress UspA family protein
MLGSDMPPAGSDFGPNIFAYDGSELAGAAIAKAAGLLDRTREVLVVTVWQPAEVGFTPVDGHHFNADSADEVGAAALATADHGAALGEEAGFKASGLAVEFSPTFEGILHAADEHSAGVIALGAVQRHGVLGHLLGSVAAAVVAHSTRPVLVLYLQ